MPRRPVSSAQLELLSEPKSNVIPFRQKLNPNRRVDFGSEPQTSKRKKVYKPRNPKAYLAALEDAKRRVEQRGKDETWKGADERTLLGIYAISHVHTYEIEPSDLIDEWGIAVQHVRRFVDREFEGNVMKAVAFVRWCWKRELFRMENREPEHRLLWKWVFSVRAATDYRMASRMRASR